MDEEAQSEGQPREPKIDLVTGIGIFLAMGTLDLAELIPFVGDFTSIPAYGVNFYLSSKGISGVVFAVGNTLDLIPILQEFPCKTIGWLITWGIDHFAPAAVSETLEKAGEMAQAKAGKGAKEGVEGAATGKEAKAITEEAAVRAEGGVGAVAEGGGIAEGGPTTAAPGTEEAGGARVSGAGAGEEAPTTEGGGTAEGEGAKEIEPEAFGQERELLGSEGQLEKELLEETPKRQPGSASSESAEEEEEYEEENAA
jgi:hypothetical protein